MAESRALRPAPALTAMVAFTLTDDFVGNTVELSAPEPDRALNIIMNQAPNGTHSFFVDGAGPPRQFDLGETEIIEKAEVARDLLRELADANDRKYRFDDQNRGGSDSSRSMRLVLPSSATPYSSTLSRATTATSPIACALRSMSLVE